ncbi:MAG: hypothetical protein KAT68_12435 [Bacteroidales bacterium]|nr:hypothetical protein [Bacteroidales bacterium]
MKKSLIHIYHIKFIRNTFIVFLIFLYNLSLCQTGIFYFSNNSDKYPNNKFINLLEASNKEIYLLGKVSDKDYKISQAHFTRLDKKGNLLLQKTLQANSLYDLNNIILMPDQNIKIFGNEKTDNKYSPYIRTFNSNGTIKKSTNNVSVYSTMINDVVVFDNENILITETKLGKSQKYNINIYLYNLKTDKQVWYKKISSELNEEADQIIIDNNNNIIILGKKYNDKLTAYVPIIYKLNSSGEKIWKKGLEVPDNFFSQSISTDTNGKIFYICNYSRESTGECETRIISISSKSDIENYEILREISANGIIALNNGNFFIFGSNLLIYNNQVITKGKYIIINNKFEILTKDELSNNDFPDSKFIGSSKSILPSSSDLLSAIQLSDGRIACSGRIIMPKNLNPDKIANSPRFNNALLLIMDISGNFR